MEIRRDRSDEAGDKLGQMPSTHWSLVRRAGGGDTSDGAARHEALGELLRRYIPALRAYLLGRRFPPDAIDDLVQGFVTDKVIEKRILRHAAAGRGRFRTFLLTSLHNYAISQWRRDTVRRPAGREPLEAAAEVPAPDISPSVATDAAWARALVGEALARMAAACGDRPHLYRVFEARVLPEMRGEPAAPYEAIVAELGLASPAQAANLLVTAKRLYARLLREAVGEYECSISAIDGELRDLRTALAAGRRRA